MEPVEKEFPVIAEHFGNLLHRLEPGTHAPGAPFIEESACPIGGDVFPESLEIFLEQITPHRLQIAFEKVAEFVHLFVGKVVRSFQQTPSTPGQNRLQSFALKFLDLAGPNLVEGLTHVAHDMEPIQDIDRFRRHLGDDPKVRLPHVAAYKSQTLASFRTKPLEESPVGSGCAIPTDPEQSPLSDVELIHQSDKLFFHRFPPTNLVGADGFNVLQITMGESPIHRHLDGTVDILPSTVKGSGHLKPGKPFSPISKKPYIGCGQMPFPLRPRDPFDLNAASRTVDPAHGVQKEDSDPPQGNKLEMAHGLGVITGAGLATTRTDWSAAFPCPNLHFKCQTVATFTETGLAVHKTFVDLDSIQYRLYLHPVSPPLAMDFSSISIMPKKENGMLLFSYSVREYFQFSDELLGPDGTHRFC